MIKGVDISTHNGNVDFKKLISAGIEFVIIRCGYGQDRQNQDDSWYKRNVQKAIENNIPFGVYLYSYADTIQKAKSEAKHMLRLLNGTKPAYGVWYDVEDKIHPQDKTLLTDICITFCEEMERNGLYTGVYSSLHWFNTRFDERINQYDKWVAQWADQCTYKGNYGIWQYTDNLRIGNKKFDGNYSLKNYPEIINPPKPSKPAKPAEPKKSVNDIAIEVLNGKWGEGTERKQKLTKAGYDYNKVQKRVNEYYKLAERCYNGDFGNGNTRKSKVTKLGFDYKSVQKLVNEMQ